MKNPFYALLSLLISFFIFVVPAVAQTQQPTQPTVVTAEDIAGKTFWTISSFGTTVQYYRPDFTFKACGDGRYWCDEGTWSFVDEKIVRVYKSWFQPQNYRPTPSKVIRQPDGKYTFGAGAWTVLQETEKIPPGVIADPRK